MSKTNSQVLLLLLGVCLKCVHNYSVFSLNASQSWFIFFPSSLCFPVMSTRFLFNKGKHAISHNGTFSSVVCPWVGVLAYLLCLCVCLGGMRHSGGLRPEMGRVLLSSLNYLARGGVCGSTPALASTGDCKAELTVFFLQACADFCCVFIQWETHTYCSFVAITGSQFTKRGCTASDHH